VADDDVTIRHEPAPEATQARGETEVPETLPVMPLRDLVLFPGLVQPLNVGRERSLALAQDVVVKDRVFAVTAQKDDAVEEPDFDELYGIGCAVRVLKLMPLSEGNQTVIVQAFSRIRLDPPVQVDPYFVAPVTAMPDEVQDDREMEALVRSARDLMSRIIDLSPRIPPEASAVVAGIESPGSLADFIAANMNISIEEKQDLLAETDVAKRLRTVTDVMQREIEVLEIANKIQTDAREKIESTQREYYLREQLKAIQRELGEADEKTQLIDQLRGDLEQADLPEEVQAEADRELSRLEAMPVQAPDFNVVRTYLEYLAELPWETESEDRLDLQRAADILDKDHYGLEQPKKRIVEYLAVRKLRQDLRGPILCLVGPPGVGKTSLGQSIARAMGRKFVRMSLGGMRDEAEIRGHRRTYVGALPGRIIQELRKVGVRNPVFMLDEVDKLGHDWRGDPTSALLEVLDPEQNSTFTDHYLDVPFDLSRVLFIATANVLDPVPPALKDRMEVIALPGYVEDEKLGIAQRYLVPRQREEHGLKGKQVRFTKGGLRRIIRYYTHEAGVRNLEREIAAVCRGVARRISQGETDTVTLTGKTAAEFLGPEKHLPEVKLRTSTPGVATGLGWTAYGGDILFVEATGMPGSGKMSLTGQLGDVMKESAEAALSYIRSRAETWGIDPEALRKRDLHVHVPAGAIPKDGPSAGITIFSALVSLLTDRSVSSDVAMTGEMTLRGLVLPVGGIKEKVLAAKRAGIHTVVLPERNRKDFEDISDDIRKDLAVHYVGHVDDVIPLALGDGEVGGNKSKRGKNGRSGAKGRARRKTKNKSKNRSSKR
jgi:ATP-dependent Lon protease